MAKQIQDKTEGRKIKDPKSIDHRKINWGNVFNGDMIQTLRGAAWGYKASIYSVRMVRALKSRAVRQGFRLRCATDISTNEFVLWLEIPKGLAIQRVRQLPGTKQVKRKEKTHEQKFRLVAATR